MKKDLANKIKKNHPNNNNLRTLFENNLRSLSTITSQQLKMQSHYNKYKETYYREIDSATQSLGKLIFIVLKSFYLTI